MSAVSKPTIYILQLKHGKYYVGKTSDPVRRLQEHVSGKGSEWTRLHPPVKMIRTIPGASSFDEDRYVKEYMMKYGVDNVRGGSYSNPELDEVQECALQQEIRGATDCCMRCGRKGHFTKSCYAKTDVDGDSLDDSSSDDSSDSSEDEKDDSTCYRCGRTGHYANQCYAKTVVASKWKK